MRCSTRRAGWHLHPLAGLGDPARVSSLAAVPTARPKASTTSADPATAARARAGRRITATSWLSPGHPAGPGRQSQGGPSRSHASPVTCSLGANWSPPTSAPEEVPAAPASPIAGRTFDQGDKQRRDVTCVHNPHARPGKSSADDTSRRSTEEEDMGSVRRHGERERVGAYSASIWPHEEVSFPVALCVRTGRRYRGTVAAVGCCPGGHGT